MSLADIARGVHVPLPRNAAAAPQSVTQMHADTPPSGQQATLPTVPGDAAATGHKYYHGIVKSVVSGDTLVVRGQPHGDKPPRECVISLAYVQAPRLARRPRQGEEQVEVDEPGAFEAREFLRKVLVGREVKFYIEYSSPGREYGDLIFSNDSVAKYVVSNGHARVRVRNQQSSETTGVYTRLLEFQKVAEAKKYGIFADTPLPVRSVKWNVETEDLRAFCDTHMGQPIDAIVESVRDSTTYGLMLLNEHHTHIRVSLSGVKGDGFRWEGSKETAEGVFSEEARFFTEARILQRNVKVTLEGVSNGMLYGTIVHFKGFNMAEILLREGLTRVVDWSLAKVPNPPGYRHAESMAKERSLRMWCNHDGSGQAASTVGTQVSVTVVEIVNGETFRGKTVAGDIQRFALSSIRQPRAPGSGRDARGPGGVANGDDGNDSKKGSPVNRPSPNLGKRKSMYDAPFMFEAKEFLRKKLIGKQVSLLIDYEQPARDGYPLKTCVTVRGSDGLNIAEQLVQRGLASVQQHSRNDERRSSCYDDLQVAESKAVASQKGMHSQQPYRPAVQDISGDKIKNTAYMSSLQRTPRCQAVVDHVVHGGRVKVYIPREGIITTLLISGVVTPRLGRGKGDSEPYADESTEYTKQKLLQQNIEITIEGQDKPGNFIGSVIFGGVNHSVDLVTRGLATCHPSSERLSFGKEMAAAETAAKDAKLKVWENYVEAVPEPVEAEEREVKLKEAVVTEVVSPLELYLQYTTESEGLTSLMAGVAEHFKSNPPTPGTFTPKRNAMCCAKFAVDGEWYRAKVTQLSESTATVFYIDYGNSETVKMADLAAMPAQLSETKPFAHRVALAFVQLSPEEDWVDEATQVLREEIVNKIYSVNLEYTVEDKGHVLLIDGEQDVTSALVADGLTFAAERREKRLRKLSDKYQSTEEEAREAHVGMWRYGDCRTFGENEAKEFGAPKPEKDGDKK